ncbi:MULTISPECIES: DUF2945 domain-containing protein [Novilysobacter]|uniref:DUF2945 domain-containing protein n=1 Tax=Novilysobacter TaxID=3382699 RepID=UPI002EDAC18E
MWEKSFIATCLNDGTERSPDGARKAQARPSVCAPVRGRDGVKNRARVDCPAEVRDRLRGRASSRHIKSHKVAASPEDPQYLVVSDKSGKRAAHKPDALKPTGKSS